MTTRLAVVHGDLQLNEYLRVYSRQTPDASLQIMMARGYEDGQLQWVVTVIFDHSDYDTKEFRSTEEGEAFLYFLSAVTFWEARENFAFRLLVRTEKERVRRLFWAVCSKVRRSTRPVRPREGQ